VPRRHGRTIGTFMLGACLLLLLAHALFAAYLPGPHRQRAVKAQINPAEQTLSIGAPVLTDEGTVVGTVSGISRDARGHVERIRVTETTYGGFGPRVLIIRDRFFVPREGAIQLKLSMGELDAMPTAMTEDWGGSFGRHFR
jgi:hypothetical protein